MEILGLSGSLRRDSHNARLLAGARKLLPSGVELVIFDQLAAVPPFNEDNEHTIPPAVARTPPHEFAGPVCGVSQRISPV